jgi:hypothetical protein
LTPSLLPRALWLLVAGLTAAFAALTVAQAADIAHVLQWNPDASIPWVLTLTPDHGGPRDVVDGSYGFWSVLWFDGLTRSLSFHRFLWVAQPAVLWLGTAALLAYTMFRLAGAAAAALTAALVLCSAGVMGVVLIPTMHGQTVFAGAVLAAFAIELTRARPFGGPRRFLAAGIAVAIIAGVHLTDPQLWVIGVAPLLLAIGAWRLSARDPDSRRALRAAAGVTVGAVVVWVSTTQVMRAAGYHELAPDSTDPIHALDDVWPHARTLFNMVLWLGNGAFELSTAGLLRGLLSLACAAAIVAGVALAPVLLVAELRRRRIAPMLLVHLVFWSFVVVALAGAVVLTNLASQPSVRYIVAMLLAMAVTVPLLVRGPLLVRSLALAGSAVLIAGSVVAMADREIGGGAPGIRSTIAQIEAAATSSGATTGFGDYYLASNVTWGTHGRVVSRPVVNWAVPVCPFDVAIDRAWYAPTGARRTFVLWQGSTPPVGLGTPLQAIPINGGDATFFVYDGDVATRLCR